MPNFSLSRLVGFLSLAVLGALLARPVSANVVYRFTSPSGTLASSFSFTMPSVITGTGVSAAITSFTSASDTGPGWGGCGPITAVSISDPSGGGILSTGIPINTTSCTAFFAFTSTIDTLGTFAGMFGSSESATLTITQSSATPEPSSLLLLGSGLLGLAGIKLRRIGC